MRLRKKKKEKKNNQITKRFEKISKNSDNALY